MQPSAECTVSVCARHCAGLGETGQCRPGPVWQHSAFATGLPGLGAHTDPVSRPSSFVTGRSELGCIGTQSQKPSSERTGSLYWVGILGCTVPQPVNGSKRLDSRILHDIILIPFLYYRFICFLFFCFVATYWPIEASGFAESDEVQSVINCMQQKTKHHHPLTN